MEENKVTLSLDKYMEMYEKKQKNGESIKPIM